MKAIHESARRSALVQIDQEYIRCLHLERGGARQQKELNERHQDHLPQHQLVAEDLEILLSQKNPEDSQIHATRGLKVRTASAIRNRVIPASTRVSRQRCSRPTPFSMMPRAMMMNHRAGTMLLTAWRKGGMLAIGNTIPESRELGSIVASSATSMATRCDPVSDATRTPSASDTIE